MSVLVIDIGGGTTDLETITLSGLAPLRAAEPIVPAGKLLSFASSNTADMICTAGKYGSTSIDRNLRKFLKEELGEIFASLPLSKTGAGSRFHDDFEAVNRNFDGTDHSRIFRMRLPVISKKMEKIHPNSPRYDAEDGEVLITG